MTNLAALNGIRAQYRLYRDSKSTSLILEFLEPYSLRVGVNLISTRILQHMSSEA